MTDHPTRLALAQTLIDLTEARPLQRLSSGLYVPANSRGVMAAGLAGEVRVRAGADVEIELRRQRPLDVGRAYATGAGRLAAAGVEMIAHGVTRIEPGQEDRPGAGERALVSALGLFDDAGIRAITLPLVQLSFWAGGAADSALTMGAILASHIRRGARLHSITVAALDQGFLSGVEADLLAAGAIPA